MLEHEADAALKGPALPLYASGCVLSPRCNRVRIILLSTLLLSGCGLRVPEIQEIGDSLQGQRLVQAIVTNVKCEVQDAVVQLYDDYHTTFMDTWAVQLTLDLQVEEKSAVSPSVAWTPPSPISAVFNLSSGGTVSLDATRDDKMNFVFSVNDLRQRKACDPRTRPGGLYLMQSDLGLKEWLYDALTANKTGHGQFSQSAKDVVLTHDIKFEVVTSGNITPGWKLTCVLVNQSGTLFSASRDRTHHLLITLGPGQPTGKVRNGRPEFAPSDRAAFAHLSSEIGIAVSNGIRNTLPPP